MFSYIYSVIDLCTLDLSARSNWQSLTSQSLNFYSPSAHGRETSTKSIFDTLQDLTIDDIDTFDVLYEDANRIQQAPARVSTESTKWKCFPPRVEFLRRHEARP